MESSLEHRAALVSLNDAPGVAKELMVCRPYFSDATDIHYLHYDKRLTELPKVRERVAVRGTLFVSLTDRGLTVLKFILNIDHDRLGFPYLSVFTG